MAMTTAQMTKQQWINDYARRILQTWQSWPSPLGEVDESYLRHIEDQLDEQFDDPLKRALVEATY